MAKHRLYVDEVGASGKRASSDPHAQYLSLTGVVFELDYVDAVLFPEIEGLKKAYFGSHPDEPVILHRSEIVNKTPPFDALRDPMVLKRFDAQLTQHLEAWAYTVFTVVVDKVALASAFSAVRPDPYHRCLELMVTGYAALLQRRGVTGDVLAESRGGNEDQRLKQAFRQLAMSAEAIDPKGPLATLLTSRELKVKAKAMNISGLQVADLLAHPAMLATLDARAGRPRRADYGGRLITMLEGSGKYACDSVGVVEDIGRIWIP